MLAGVSTAAQGADGYALADTGATGEANWTVSVTVPCGDGGGGGGSGGAKP